MAAADYRLLTEATGVRIAEALEAVTAMVGPKGDPGEVSEAELTAKLADKADVIVDTASGAIASFPDGAAVAAKDITIGIEPVQSGSGDPSPTNVRPISGWTGAKVTRTGFNVWDEEWELGGMNTGSINSKNLIPVLPNTSYYWGCGNTASGVSFYVRYFDASENPLSGYTSASGTYLGINDVFVTPADAHFVKFRMSGQYGTTYNHNICINLSDPAKNGTYEPGHVVTIPISWQSEAGTVYGGTLDVTTGVLTVTMAEVDLGTLNWTYLPSGSTVAPFFYAPKSNIKYIGNPATIRYPFLCSKYAVGIRRAGDFNDKQIVADGSATVVNQIQIKDSAYTDAAIFKAAMSGVQLVYELATPQTHQLTPTEVEMLLGENNVWADTGDSTVTYRADTKLYIQKINAPTDDDMIADAQIASGRYFIVSGNLYKSTTTIPAGDAINPGSNCILTNLADALNALNT